MTPSNLFFSLIGALSHPDIRRSVAALPGTLSLSIVTNGCQAAAAYFKHQRLISRSSGEQALWFVERALVVKHSPSKVEFSWPVHSPVPCQEVLPFQGADGEVAGGHLHLLDSDAPCSSWDNDHRVILCGTK